MLVRTYMFTLLLASYQTMLAPDIVPDGEDTDNRQQETAAASGRAAEAARETSAARAAQEHQRLPVSGRNIISPKPPETHTIVPKARTPGQEERRIPAPEEHEIVPEDTRQPLTQDQIAAGQRALNRLKLESTASIQELDARANQLKKGLTQAAQNFNQLDPEGQQKFIQNLQNISADIQTKINEIPSSDYSLAFQKKLEQYRMQLSNANIFNRPKKNVVNNLVTILNDYIDLLQMDAQDYLQQSMPTAQVISTPTWQDTIASWWNNFKNMFSNWTASLQNALASLGLFNSSIKA